MAGHAAAAGGRPVSGRGNVGVSLRGELLQLSRSLHLTDKGNQVVDAMRATVSERPNPLGPPRPPRCYECRLILAQCVCLEVALRRRAAS